MIKRLSHKHNWQWQERGVGQYTKGQHTVQVIVAGYKAKCECGKKMFFPDQEELHPVEVE